MDNRKFVGRFHPEFAFSRQNLHIKTVILSILSVGGIKASTLHNKTGSPLPETALAFVLILN